MTRTDPARVQKRQRKEQRKRAAKEAAFRAEFDEEVAEAMDLVRMIKEQQRERKLQMLHAADRACRMLQRVVRGKQARGKLQWLVEARAARLIQRPARGWHARRYVQNKREHRAACRLQAPYRGRLARRQRAREQGAALSVQTRYRSFSARQEYKLRVEERERVRRAEEAAAAAAAAAAEVERQALIKEAELRGLEASAVKIQKRWREHKSDQELEKEAQTSLSLRGRRRSRMRQGDSFLFAVGGAMQKSGLLRSNGAIAKAVDHACYRNEGESAMESLVKVWGSGMLERIEARSKQRWLERAKGKAWQESQRRAQVRKRKMQAYERRKEEQKEKERAEEAARKLVEEKEKLETRRRAKELQKMAAMRVRKHKEMVKLQDKSTMSSDGGKNGKLKSLLLGLGQKAKRKPSLFDTLMASSSKARSDGGETAAKLKLNQTALEQQNKALTSQLASLTESFQLMQNALLKAGIDARGIAPPAGPMGMGNSAATAVSSRRFKMTAIIHNNTSTNMKIKMNGNSSNGISRLNNLHPVDNRIHISPSLQSFLQASGVDGADATTTTQPRLSPPATAGSSSRLPPTGLPLKDFKISGRRSRGGISSRGDISFDTKALSATMRMKEREKERRARSRGLSRGLSRGFSSGFSRGMLMTPGSRGSLKGIGGGILLSPAAGLSPAVGMSPKQSPAQTPPSGNSR